MCATIKNVIELSFFDRSKKGRKSMKILFTSKYPPHSGAIELSSYAMEKATLPHFTNGHLFCYSFFLIASLPQKELIYSSIFPWLNNVCKLEKGNLQVEKIDAWYSYAVLKYCGEKLLYVEGVTHGSKMETGRLPMK